MEAWLLDMWPTLYHSAESNYLQSSKKPSQRTQKTNGLRTD